MNLNQVQIFCAVAKHLSFSMAAEELFITQPAVSQQVKALERQLNVKLFERVGHKLFLTEAFQYFPGVCLRCLIDNTHVVVLRGTGKDMIPVPEMEAFAQRFGKVGFLITDLLPPSHRR